MLIVMKFGGTSVGSAERIAQAARLAIESSRKGHQVVVVTSAMSKVTDALIEAAHAASRGQWDPAIRQQLFERHRAVAETLATDRHALVAVLDQIDVQLDRFEKLCFGLSMVHELTPRLLDAISGTGEMLAAPLVAAAIRAQGGASTPVQATELIVTTDQFGGAEPIAEATQAKTEARLRPMIDRGEIPVVTGFLGATADGVLTTLGRGGSDYSASILGAAPATGATPPRGGRRADGGECCRPPAGADADRGAARSFREALFRPVDGPRADTAPARCDFRHW
jgi:aspartate kinase